MWNRATLIWLLALAAVVQAAVPAKPATPTLDESASSLNTLAIKWVNADTSVTEFGVEMKTSTASIWGVCPLQPIITYTGEFVTTCPDESLSMASGVTYEIRVVFTNIEGSSEYSDVL